MDHAKPSVTCSATLAVIWAVFFAPKTAWNGWGGFPLRDAIFLAIQGTFGKESTFSVGGTPLLISRRSVQVHYKLLVNGGLG